MNRFKRRLPEVAGLAAFFLVWFFADWLVHAASLAIFRLDAAAVPESFFVAYQADEPDARGTRYRAFAWKDYASARDKLGIRTLLLRDPAGRISSKGDSLSFRVLEDDGLRQVVEVKYDGAYKSWSRYEAYADRAVPIAYRSYGWGGEIYSRLAMLIIAAALAGLAAWGAASSVKRLVRLQQT